LLALGIVLAVLLPNLFRDLKAERPSLAGMIEEQKTGRAPQPGGRARPAILNPLAQGDDKHVLREVVGGGRLSTEDTEIAPYGRPVAPD
jgi:hypothetical protein